ncbi:cytochrome c3 family protein [Desulfurivibrio sp. C05AmB]|uniref:cytochrome c3 family protein n=1 Tax=Desulfurivibrio sp. C05AmB TaxID=3374371 RepID=UPI00376ED9BF
MPITWCFTGRARVLLLLILLLAALPAGAAAGQREEGFALDPEESCLRCHQDLAVAPHLHPAAADGFGCATACHQPLEAGTHAFTPLPADLGPVCADCHQDPALTKKQQAHPAAAAGRCGDCHEPHQSAFPRLLRQAPEHLCLACHTAAGSQCSLGCREVREGTCATCHLPHRAAEAGLLRLPQGELCLSCHEPFSGPVEHGPVIEGKCASCHASPFLALADERAAAPDFAPAADPEAPPPSRMQLAQPEICFACHDRRQTRAAGQAVPPIQPLFDDPEAFLHAPFAKGRCSDCHRPHVSEYPSLLTEPYPAGLYTGYSEEAYALCFQCHDSDNLTRFRTSRDTGFRNGEMNLHFRHVNRAKGRSCGACHSAHGSRQPFMISPVVRFGQAALGQRFEKTDTGGSCATACHIEVGYDREEPVDNRLRTSPWPD